MSEKLFEQFSRSAQKDRIFKELKQAREKHGPKNAVEHFLKSMNAKVKYVREGDPAFTQDRKRLNSERGLIISVHPGGGTDTAAIVNALERTDLKIIAQDNSAEKFGDLFGKGVLIPVAKNNIRESLPKVLDTAVEHISNGGVILVYPSSDRDRPGQHNRFRIVFRSLVSRIDPGDMVYAFCPDEKEANKVRDRYEQPTKFLLRHAMPTITVSVDERYTKASQWQRIIEQGLNKVQVEEDLRSHYDGLFKEKNKK